MKTRTTQSKNTSAPSTKPDEGAAMLKPSTERPPQLFILPSSIDTNARIISLIDPSTSIPRRYLFGPDFGVFEIKKIGTNHQYPKSWLLSGQSLFQLSADRRLTGQDVSPNEEERPLISTDGASTLSKGYILQNADIYIATALDPLFLLFPVFGSGINSEKASWTEKFCSGEDHLDNISKTSLHMASILRHSSFRQTLLCRLWHVSETKILGEETFCKPSREKLMDELMKKAAMMTSIAWPPSLEEKFVSQTLNVPVASFIRDESSTDSDGPASADASQASTAATSEEALSFSTPGLDDASQKQPAETFIKDIVPIEADKRHPEYPTTSTSASTEIAHQMRLRVALDFLMSSYLPQELRKSLQTMLSEPSSGRGVDFAALNTQLDKVEKLRKQAHALRTLSENISRKRTIDNDEATEAQIEKKRKKEEEEKRKKLESRALKNLKKTDTSGMQKLSSFFTKAAHTKRAT